MIDALRVWLCAAACACPVIATAEPVTDGSGSLEMRELSRCPVRPRALLSRRCRRVFDHDQPTTITSLAVAQVGEQTGTGTDTRSGTPANRPVDDERESKSTFARVRDSRIARTARAVFGKRALSERVTFRFNIGVGLDGGELNGEPARLRSGSELAATDYADLRIYSFGNVVLGTRGVMSPRLSTYIASQFRIDQDPGAATTALPTVYDATVLEQKVRDSWTRSAYATWQGIGNGRWTKPVFIRVGRQYRYGPAIAHFDGITVGYDTPTASVGAFSGTAVEVTGVQLGGLYRDRAVMSGLDGRLDLHQLNRLPLVLSGELLHFNAQLHMRGSLALRVNRDIALSANMRSLSGEIARTGVQLRARISKVTTVHIDVESRSIHDWMYDLFATEQASAAANPDSPLHYFRLGKPLPRLYLGGRAGVVLLRNIDLLVHGRAAIRRATGDDPASEPESPHASSYAQGGGAVEIRVRRSVALGLSLLARRYWRSTPESSSEETPTTLDVSRNADPLILDSNSVGERSFFDFGSTLSYSQGARKFSARTEVYVRYYRFQSQYLDIDNIRPKLTPETTPDVRAGARFVDEGWAGDNLRLKAEYELTSELLITPELRGMKSLRILAEGRF